MVSHPILLISSVSASRGRQLQIIGMDYLTKSQRMQTVVCLTYRRQCWRCDTEFPETDRTPLLSQSFHQTSAMICHHVERRRQTAQSMTKQKQTKLSVCYKPSSLNLINPVLYKQTLVLFVHVSSWNLWNPIWPSQTGAPWRCRECPCHESQLPVWSRWRSRRSGWEGPRVLATRLLGRLQWAVPRWQSGTSHQWNCRRTSRCPSRWPGRGQILKRTNQNNWNFKVTSI